MPPMVRERSKSSYLGVDPRVSDQHRELFVRQHGGRQLVLVDLWNRRPLRHVLGDKLLAPRILKHAEHSGPHVTDALARVPLAVHALDFAIGRALSTP